MHFHKINFIAAIDYENIYTMEIYGVYMLDILGVA